MSQSALAKPSPFRGSATADYRLLTIWRIKAPLAVVYAAIQDSLQWPAWWPAVKSVEQLEAGGADGVNNVRRYIWQGRLPYRLSFDVRTTRIQALMAIEAAASGDLEGIGRWYFSHRGEISIVRYEWQVRSTLWWMKLLTPVARSVFIRNHAEIMTRGGEGLARLLNCPLAAEETVDLTTTGSPARVVHDHRRERGRIDFMMLLMVGLGAGTIATIVQILLWWLALEPAAEMLFRDARLTAAMLMGPEILLLSSAPQWDILIVATLIHFFLSVGYALAPSFFAGYLRLGPAIVIGALYGLAIYVINLYALTAFFPWFDVARGWIALLAHLAFGVALVGGCQLFSTRK